MNPVRTLFKRNLIVLSFLSTLIVGAETPLPFAQPATTETIKGNIDDIAKAILTYFPKVVGEIAVIEADHVKVDIGKEQGLSAGILLTVFREGDPFLHPVTGVPLGRFEDELGIMEVIRFEGHFLRAAFPETIGVIVVGDRVRIPATRIPIAVSMSDASGHAFLMSELVSALKDTGRFNIETLPPGSHVSEGFKGRNRYHIQLSTSRDETQFTMHLKIQNTLTGRQIDALNVRINQSEESDLILEHLQFQLFEQRQKKDLQ